MFNKTVGCIIGYLLLALPVFYWFIVDLLQLKREYFLKRKNAKIGDVDTVIKEEGVPFKKVELSSNSDKEWFNVKQTTQQENENSEDDVSNNGHSLDDLIKISNICLWFGLMISSYILLRICVNYLNWKRRFKYVVMDCQDIFELCIRSFLIYILGNISYRFAEWDRKKSFVSHIIYFLITYTATFQSFPNIEIGGKGIQNGMSVVLCTPFVIVVIYILFRNFYDVYMQSGSIKILYFSGIAIFGIVQGIMIGFASNIVVIHIHHHYWSLILSLICRSSNKMTSVFQAFLIAVFIHGIAVFGCEDIFQWKENINQEYFEEECNEWLCPAWKCIM